MSTPDLIVTEFWMRCGQTDLASACAAPLESFGPVFQDGKGDGENKRRSGVYQTKVGGGGYNEGRS